jgi:hypothetical protein
LAAALPEPVPGLVFRYDYLRPRLHEEGVENPKERPACILLVLKAGEVLTGATLIDEMSGRNVVDYTASEGDIVIFPIQTDPPDANQLGVELSLDTKAYVGLPGGQAILGHHLGGQHRSVAELGTGPDPRNGCVRLSTAPPRTRDGGHSQNLSQASRAEPGSRAGPPFLTDGP